MMWVWVLLCFLSLPIVAFLILFFANTEDDDTVTQKLSETQKENLRKSLYNKVSQDQHVDNYNYVIKTFGAAYSGYDDELNRDHKKYRGTDRWEYYTVHKLSKYGSLYFPNDFPRYLLKTSVTNGFGSYECNNAKKYMSEFNDLVLTLKQHADIILLCKKYGIYVNIEALLKSKF